MSAAVRGILSVLDTTDTHTCLSEPELTRCHSATVGEACLPRGPTGTTRAYLGPASSWPATDNDKCAKRPSWDCSSDLCSPNRRAVEQTDKPGLVWVVDKPMCRERTDGRSQGNGSSMASISSNITERSQGGAARVRALGVISGSHQPYGGEFICTASWSRYPIPLECVVPG